MLPQLFQKKFETEVIKKGEEYTPEKLKEVTDVTSNLSGSKDKKTQKIAEDMMIAQNSGLDTFAIAENLNEFGINTINAKDIIEAITKAQQANSGQALRRAQDISSELRDQERFGSIIGTSSGEVDLALRQVQIIAGGDPRNFRALEIEKYGKKLGLSMDVINKGIEAVFSGDIETEKQVFTKILKSMEESPDWEINIEINDAVMNDLMVKMIAQERTVYAVMNSDVLKPADLSPYIEDQVVVTDVAGWVKAQQDNDKRISEFADEVGDYLASAGTYDAQTIAMVKHTINYHGDSGRSAKTISAMVMAELEGERYKQAYYKIDAHVTGINAQSAAIISDWSRASTQTLADEAAMIEATLNGDNQSYSRAYYYDEDTVKLSASQKEDLSKVYNNALDFIDKKNAAISVVAIEETTIAATEAAAKVITVNAEVEIFNQSLNEKLVAKENAEKKFKEVLELQKKVRQLFKKV